MLHEYEVAPDTLSKIEPPIQTDEVVSDVVIIGCNLVVIVTICVFVAVQLFLVTVTVKVESWAGVTVICGLV